MSKDSPAHKRFKMVQRRHRVRHRLHGTAERPRLSVHISNKHISAQIINDESRRTIVYVTTVGQKTAGSLTDKAAWIGAQVAKNAQNAKVKRVIFDRGERKYHGRVKKLAEAARTGGLKF